MKKPRSDAKLLNLPEEQKSQLCGWLLSGMPLHIVNGLVKKQFNVETSLSGLSHFYSVECVALLMRNRQRAVFTADEIAEAAAKDPGRFDQATIDALKQQAFELAIAPGADPKNVKALFSLVLKSKDQALAEKQISLDREKFEFDAAGAALHNLESLRHIAGDRKLDNRAKLDAVRMKLFGEAPK